MRLKALLWIGLLFIYLSQPVLSNEEIAVWRRLYTQAETIEQRNSVLGRMIALDNRDLADVYHEALITVNLERPSITGVTKRRAHNQLTGRLITELGRIQAQDSATDIYQTLFDVPDDPFLQARAIRALGNIGAVDYVDGLVALLNNINNGVVVYNRRQEEETVVLSLVYALERFRLPSAFSSVFYTAIGHYSSPVLGRAREALITMVEDPTDLLETILIQDTDFQVKSRVLDIIVDSDAPAESRVRLAIRALDEGLRQHPDSIRDANSAAQLRIDACRILIDTGIMDLAAIPMLDEMLRASYSHMETMIVLETLATSASDEASTVLVAFLNDLNKKRQSGYTFPNETLVRASIQALASTGNQLGREALLEVEHSGWSGDTRRLARTVLENF